MRALACLSTSLALVAPVLAARWARQASASEGSSSDVRNSTLAPPSRTSVSSAASTSLASRSAASNSASATPNSSGSGTPDPLASVTSSSAAASGAGRGSPRLPVASAINQPSIPSGWVRNDPSIYTLSPDFEITDVPTTREHWFSIDAIGGAPDGYSRLMYVVNGQYPGPLIEANEGDTVRVHVTNNLDHGQAIHWHGIMQNGSQWMDGVPGVSQCVIPPNGGQFTYEFRITQQFGSYWWHSHYSNQLADGIVGGLIVHSVNDPLRRGEHFDEERVLYVSDWMDVTSDAVVEALHYVGSFDGNIAPPQGDAILINGRGQTNCSNSEIRHSAPCITPDLTEITVPTNKRIRFRVLNTGAHMVYRISMDNHAIELVEMDDTPIWGPTFHELQISPGQRYSFIVTTDQGGEGSKFWLRVRVALKCGFFAQEANAIIRYGGGSGEPSTQPWDDLAPDSAPCVDMDENYSLRPRIPQDAPDHPLQVHVLSSSRGVFVDVNGFTYAGQGFNNISYKNQINDPLLSQVESGLSLDDSLIAHIQFDGVGGGDIVVNNLDLGISHPFHLHGRSFYLVGRGTGNITAEQAWGMNFQSSNPPRRDTLQIAGASWAVLRLMTDTPGVWPIHCHIGWHLSEGKMAAVVIQPDTIKGFKQPPEWSGLCTGLDKFAWGPNK